MILYQALNKGEKPPIIADRIEVKELNMGTIVRSIPCERRATRGLTTTGSSHLKWRYSRLETSRPTDSEVSSGSPTLETRSLSSRPKSRSVQSPPPSR